MSFIAGLMILAAGLIVVFGEVAAVRELRRIRSWSQTEGRVQAFTVSKSLVGDVFPSISYRYEVNGKEYTGDVIRPGGRTSFRSRRTAKEMERTYIAGGPVTVYYDPERPADCCIDREETAGGKSAIFWGISIAALGAYVLYRAAVQ